MTPEQLTDWYAQYRGPLFRAAMAITRNAADAEEVVNDAFTKAWAEAARFDDRRGAALGWLVTITRSRALDLVRSRARRLRAYDRAEVHYSATDEMWRVAGPDECDPTEQEERHRTVSRALGALPGEQREAIELTFLHDTSHVRAARHLGVPLGTVKTRVRLGLRKMRAALATQ